MAASGVALANLAAGIDWLTSGVGAVSVGQGRSVYVYLRDTSTPVPVYSDEGLTVPLSQPLTTGTVSAGVPGGVPGYVVSGTSLDFVDVLSGNRAQSEALAAKDVVGADGDIGSGGIPLSGPAIASAGGLLKSGALTNGNLLESNPSGKAIDSGITALSVVTSSSGGGIPAWAPSTVYALNTLVTNGGNTYICKTASPSRSDNARGSTVTGSFANRSRHCC